MGVVRRTLLVGVLLAALGGLRAAVGEEPPEASAGSPADQEQRSPEARASEFVKALTAAPPEGAALEAAALLAAGDGSDLWIVVDECLALGSVTAARAVAATAKGRERERLESYLARPVAVDALSDLRGALRTAQELRAGSTLAAARAVLEPALSAAPRDCVLRIRLERERAALLSDEADSGVLASAHEAAARSAMEVGWHDGGQRDWVAAAEAWYYAGEYSRGIGCLQRAYPLAAEDGAPTSLATVKRYLGLFHSQQGDDPSAERWLREAVRAYEGLHRPADTFQCLSDLLAILTRRGDYLAALRARADAEAALSRLRAPGAPGEDARVRPIQEAEFARRKGNLLLLLGEPRAALEELKQALELAQKSEDPLDRAVTLGARGQALDALGEWDEAEAALQAALRAFESQGQEARSFVTPALNALAMLRLRRGHAEAHALAVREPDAAKRSRLGDEARAKHWRQGLAMAAAAVAPYARPGVAPNLALVATLDTLGALHTALGQHAEASRALARAAATARHLKLPLLAAVVGTSQARLELAQGNVRAALDAARDNVERLEQLTSGLPDTFRARVREGLLTSVDVGIAAAARLPADESELALEALHEFLEESRSMALLDSFGGRSGLNELAVPRALTSALDRASAGKERAHRQYVTLKAMKPEAAAALPRRAGESAFQAYGRALNEAWQGYERCCDDERAAWSAVDQAARDPRQEQRLRPLRPLLAQLRDALGLRSNDAFVSVALLPEEAWALIVDGQGARRARLAGTAAEVQALRTHAQALSGASSESQPRLSGPAATQARAYLREHLWNPLGLTGATERLLFSPDAELTYLPIQALLEEGRALDVAFVPSASVQAFLRSESRPQGQGVLGFGDPDYRAAATGRPAAEPPPALALRAGGPSLNNLAFAGAELAALASLPDSRVVRGAEATEGRLWAELGAVGPDRMLRVLHIVAHGLVDVALPSGTAIALMPGGEEDGYLSVREVWSRRVPAELVVLSACRTGRGELVRGEGVIGLVRAFMFAGASRVLVSLWDVDDEATATLMTEFHRRLHLGADAARALREAQEAVRRVKPDPVFWAGWSLWGLP